MQKVGVYPGSKALLFRKLRLKMAATAKPRTAMYAETRQSIIYTPPAEKAGGSACVLYTLPAFIEMNGKM